MKDLFLLAVASWLTAGGQANIWPYHGSATGAVIDDYYYDEPRQYQQHVNVPATGSYAANPIVVRGPVTSSRTIIGPTEGSTLVQGPRRGSVSVVGPSEGRTTIMGPSQRTVIGPNADGTSTVGLSTGGSIIVDPNGGGTQVIGPTETSTTIHGPKRQQATIIGPNTYSNPPVHHHAGQPLVHVSGNGYQGDYSHERPAYYQHNHPRQIYDEHRHVVCPPALAGWSASAAARAITEAASRHGAVQVSSVQGRPVVTISGPNCAHPEHNNDRHAFVHHSQGAYISQGPSGSVIHGPSGEISVTNAQGWY